MFQDNLCGHWKNVKSFIVLNVLLFLDHACLFYIDVSNYYKNCEHYVFLKKLMLTSHQRSTDLTALSFLMPVFQLKYFDIS